MSVKYLCEAPVFKAFLNAEISRTASASGASAQAEHSAFRRCRELLFDGTPENSVTMAEQAAAAEEKRLRPAAEADDGSLKTTDTRKPKRR